MEITIERALFANLVISFLHVHAKVNSIAFINDEEKKDWIKYQSSSKTNTMKSAIMQAMSNQEEAEKTIESNYNFIAS